MHLFKLVYCIKWWVLHWIFITLTQINQYLVTFNNQSTQLLVTFLVKLCHPMKIFHRLVISKQGSVPPTEYHMSTITWRNQSFMPLVWGHIPTILSPDFTGSIVHHPSSFFTPGGRSSTQRFLYAMVDPYLFLNQCGPWQKNRKAEHSSGLIPPTQTITKE